MHDNKQITDPKGTKGTVMPERQKIAYSVVRPKAHEPQRRLPLGVDSDEMYTKGCVAACARSYKPAEDLLNDLEPVLSVHTDMPRADTNSSVVVEPSSPPLELWPLSPPPLDGVEIQPPTNILSPLPDEERDGPMNGAVEGENVTCS